ncbi:MAG: hypothetical protein AABY11_03535, partial [archaeon]
DDLASVNVDLLNEDRKTLAQLQPQGALYTQNPFFWTPFNGATSTDDRSEFGSPLSIDPAFGTITGNGATNYALVGNTMEYLTKTSQANGGLPVLFSLDRTGTSITTNSTPHYPIPIKLNFRSSVAPTNFSYSIVQQGNQNPGVSADAINWFDCTATNPQREQTTGGPACANYLNGATRTISESFPGDYYYTGTLLLPTQAGVQHDLHLACANQEATVETIKGSFEVDNLQDLQKAILNLDSSYAYGAGVNPPVTLQQLMDSIQSGDACGKSNANAFSVIWALDKVTPPNLTCQSN